MQNKELYDSTREEALADGVPESSLVLYGFDEKGEPRVTAPRKSDRHTLTIRIPPSLHQRIAKVAAEDCDTVAAVVRRMLRLAVEQRSAQ